MKCHLGISNFLFNLFILIGGKLLYNIVMVLRYISHRYTRVPHPEPPPSPSPSHPSGSSQCTSPEHPVSCTEPGLSLIFLKRSLIFPFYCFPLFLCTDPWGRLSYLSLLFFGTLHSNGYIFPFLLCFSLLFFSQLFVRPPQTAILLFCISFSWGLSWSLSPIQCHKPPSIVHQALCLSDLVS